jgi:uncharacterized protein (UPF0333 family)
MATGRHDRALLGCHNGMAAIAPAAASSANQVRAQAPAAQCYSRQRNVQRNVQRNNVQRNVQRNNVQRNVQRNNVQRNVQTAQGSHGEATRKHAQ